MKKKIKRSVRQIRSLIFISIVYKVTKRRFVNACVSVNKILAMTRIRKMVILKVGKCDKA